jgi:cytidyltransferase-like protein
MLELEDEDGDPVGGRTLAIVPGAFKPPHLGHLSMVKQYAAEADEVIVLISSPLKESRGIGGNPITAQQSKEIWEMLLADQGLSNVRVEISPKPSPISATYEYVGEEGPLEPGTKLVLGASQKGGDFKRWKGAAKYVKPGVELLPPAETAVIPAEHNNEYRDLLIAEKDKKSDLYKNMPSVSSGKSHMDFHASDFRFVLEQSVKNNVARKMLEYFVGEQNVIKILEILGLKSIEEVSGVGGGAVQGFAGVKDEEERKTLTR